MSPSSRTTDQRRPASAGQRVLEEALDEAHALLVAEAGEVGAHVVDRDGQVVDRRELLVGGREALEGVGDPHRAVGAERVERGAHQDRSAAAPGAGLDQVALDAVAHDGLDAGLQVVEPLQAGHRRAVQGPVDAGHPDPKDLAAPSSRDSSVPSVCFQTDVVLGPARSQRLSLSSSR